MAITRYGKDLIGEYEGELFYEIPEPLVLEVHESDITYRVKTGDTLRGIAFQLYGEARFYWIIGELNRIIDPWEPLEDDTELRCPTLKRVREEVF